MNRIGKSGKKGVSVYKYKDTVYYIARVTRRNGYEQKYLGSHATVEQAEKAIEEYKEEKRDGLRRISKEKNNINRRQRL